MQKLQFPTKNRLYDRLFSVPNPEVTDGEDFTENINPEFSQDLGDSALPSQTLVPNESRSPLSIRKNWLFL
jgi:hypothetical protein